MIVDDLSFHHYGLAVSAPEESKAFVAHLGYIMGEPVFDPEQKVNLIWCEHGKLPSIEIIYPADGPGPLDNILKVRDAHIYHVCYECPSIDRTVRSIKEAGIQLVRAAPPKPAVLFGGRKVCFYLVKGFGLIELLESKG